MPHKRQKRSLRLETSKARGQDNPPTAADSLLPITTTAKDGTEAKTEDGEGKKRSNKRRKGAAGGGGGGGQQDMAGMSKSAYRIINAVALREEHHAKKKRKLEEDEGKNPNQKKKPTLTPLPYESLSSFNRRVEQELRGSVRSAIKDAGAAAQKKRDKKGKEKAKKNGEDDEEGDEEEEEEKGKPGKGKKPKPTPEESFDPFASKRLQQQQREAEQNRSGKTEFASAPLRRRVDDVVQAPPTLAPAARKGLLAKVLGPGGAASAGGVNSEGGPVGGYRLKGAEEAVGSSRLPINPAMKALLDKERERAVKMYRELKEKKEQEKAGH
ncbi:hypothetical protein JCM11251_000375 [Rhodosporidiobolus azoricus]